MLGLRFYTNERHPQSWFTDGTLDWLWPAAERAHVPVALGAAMFLPTVGKIAERHPGLKLIVDHMGIWSFTPLQAGGQAAVDLRPYASPPFTTGVILGAASPVYSGLLAGLAPFLRPKKVARHQKPANHRPRRERIYWDLDCFVPHGLRTLAWRRRSPIAGSTGQTSIGQ